jgi:hypothetical protein
MGEGKKDKKDKKDKKAAAAAGNGVGDVQAVTDFLIKPEKTGLGKSQIACCACCGCT